MYTMAGLGGLHIVLISGFDAVKERDTVHMKNCGRTAP